MKRVKVYTYSDPKNWVHHQEYNAMKDAVHICATSNMRKGILQAYGDKFAPVITVRKLLQKVFENWYSPEKKMQQYLSFSKSIRDYNFTNQLLKQAFRKNNEELLNSIRMLVQAGVRPEDLDEVEDMTEKEKEFQHVWQNYEVIDQSLNNHRGILLNCSESGKIIEQALGKNPEEMVIYLHGFYFITPEQQIFFKFLQRLGVELRFFQYYNPRFPNTFDFIRNFINEDFQWPSDWEIPQSQENERQEIIAEQFLEAYEARVGLKVESMYPITNYNTFFEFLQDVILPSYPLEEEFKVKKNLKIFATNADEINELLQLYYPSLDKKNRSFLSHPLGQFLMNIHKVYQGCNMCLTGDLLMELFSSGWLVDERTLEKATDYTYDLQQILPYFVGCHLLDDWLERIKVLLTQKEEIQHTFKASSSSRIDRSLSSPFNKLSYYSIDTERVSQIKDFIVGLSLLVDDLFIPSEETNTIDDHFKRLIRMMQHRKTTSAFSDDIEKNLIDKLLYRLSTIDDASEFLYEDLQPALFLYLNGKFDDAGSKEQGVITDFLELDGEIFKENDEVVYFTGLDDHSLPLGQIDLPWPLQLSSFEQLSRQHRALQLHLNRNASVKENSRFLFYIALNFIPKEKLRLSWISNMLDRQDLNAALYTRQLHMDVKPYITKQKESIEDPYIEVELDNINEVEQQDAWKSLNSPGMLAEYQLCPKRFYYSYIVDEYPVFSNDFHHGFIFSEIYKLAAGVENRSIDKTLSEVGHLFPQWKRFKKESIAYDSHASRYKIEYDKSKMLYNQYFPGLRNKVREPLFDQDVPHIRATLLDAKTTLESKSGYHCRFCPHNNYCKDVQHSVDN